MAKRILPLTILLLALVLSGCELTDDSDTAPAMEPSAISEEESTEEDPSIAEADIEANWQIFDEARAATEALDNKEYQTMVYTKVTEGEASVTQTVNMNLRFTGAHQSAPQIAATGSVKAKDKLISLSIYFKDGQLYMASGQSRSKQEADFETAACQVDVLRSFRNELKEENITQITCEENLDGTRQISLQFSGLINNLETTGFGEIVIDGSGLISSEGYSMTTDNGEQKVVQSVEVSLIDYGDGMEAISFPDLSLY